MPRETPYNTRGLENAHPVSFGTTIDRSCLDMKRQTTDLRRILAKHVVILEDKRVIKEHRLEEFLA